MPNDMRYTSERELLQSIIARIEKGKEGKKENYDNSNKSKDQENNNLTESLFEEKTVVIQTEKKINSYSENKKAYENINKSNFVISGEKQFVKITQNEPTSILHVEQHTTQHIEEKQQFLVQAKRSRGRPRKVNTTTNAVTEKFVESHAIKKENTISGTIKRGRGRPRKEVQSENNLTQTVINKQDKVNVNEQEHQDLLSLFEEKQEVFNLNIQQKNVEKNEIDNVASLDVKHNSQLSKTLKSDLKKEIDNKSPLSFAEHSIKDTKEKTRFENINTKWVIDEQPHQKQSEIFDLNDDIADDEEANRLFQEELFQEKQRQKEAKKLEVLRLTEEKKIAKENKRKQRLQIAQEKKNAQEILKSEKLAQKNKLKAEKELQKIEQKKKQQEQNELKQKQLALLKEEKQKNKEKERLEAVIAFEVLRAKREQENKILAKQLEKERAELKALQEARKFEYAERIKENKKLQELKYIEKIKNKEICKKIKEDKKLEQKEKKEAEKILKQKKHFEEKNALEKIKEQKKLEKQQKLAELKKQNELKENQKLKEKQLKAEKTKITKQAKEKIPFFNFKKNNKMDDTQNKNETNLVKNASEDKIEKNINIASINEQIKYVQANIKDNDKLKTFQENVMPIYNSKEIIIQNANEEKIKIKATKDAKKQIKILEKQKPNIVDKKRKGSQYCGVLSCQSIRILGIICLILASIAICYPLLESVVSNMPIWAGVVNQISQMAGLIALPFMLVATFAVLRRRPNMIKKYLVLYFLIAVFVYIVAVVIIGRYITGYGTLILNDPFDASVLNDNILIALFAQTIHYNIFIDMFICLLFYFFVMYRPKKRNKIKVILLRCLSIIPVAYVLGSMIISCGAVDVSSKYVLGALTCNTPELFIIFFALTLYCKIYENKLIMKSNNFEEVNNILQSDKSFRNQSIATAIIIAIVCLLSYGMSMVPVLCEYGFGKVLGYAIVIPFVLLLSSHKKCGNVKHDLYMTIIAVVLVALIYYEFTYNILFSCLK